MALNLSTLTSSATSADVLAEVLTTADFLEPVPVLRNLSRGSNKGGDAKQDVALNQPKALPLIKNPAGNLGGYLYIPDVTGNYATGPSVTIGANETWEAEVDMVITQFGNYIMPMGGGGWTSGFSLLIYDDGRVRVFSKSDVSSKSNYGVVPLDTPFNLKYGFNGSALYVELNSQSLVTTSTGSNQAASITHPLHLAPQNNLGHEGNYAIQKAKLTVNSSVVFDCDFNGSTSIRHGDTKFQAAVGGPVTINKSGNDPATVIKKSVLRFDGVNDGLNGLLNQTITGGYMFAAFSVLGNGGAAPQYNRIFSCNSTGSPDSSGGGFTLRRDVGSDDLMVRYNANNISLHDDFFDDERGDYLIDLKVLGGSQQSKVNNADADSGVGTVAGDLSAEEFGVASTGDSTQTALDLEFLALFPADSVPDEATATKIRNYINNRNNVFSLVDGFGYYFFESSATSNGQVFSSGGYPWNGRIAGSDNGDTNKYLYQDTLNDRPTSDGYKITFADNTDHFNIASTTQAGWQVVGTSLGTFAYRVNNSAQTEINLLGYASHSRKVGDLYGIILLPESATGADIQKARQLLIDRGAADGAAGTTLASYFRNRDDILEFYPLDTSNITQWNTAFRNSNLTSFPDLDFSSATTIPELCKNTDITSFPLVDTSNVTSANQAFYNCTQLSSFPALDLSQCNSFTSTWRGCSALTSFPAGAKLGTAATNVNFSATWKSSGLTSFPALDLSNGSNFSEAWAYGNLTSFSAGAKLGTNSTNVNFSSAWISGDFTSFPALDLSKGTNFSNAWRGCSALTSFPAGANLGTAATGTVNFTNAWKASGLTSFSTPLPTATAVSLAWIECSSLSSFSSELPLVTNVSQAWQTCTSLTSFNTELPLAAAISYAWYGCSSMTDFSADVFANWNPSSISTGVFNNAWKACTSLTAQSVENILTSIDASGHYATTNKVSGGTALADAGIDIDYDGTTLSAATNSAVTSLKSKGWSIIVNNVTL